MYNLQNTILILRRDTTLSSTITKLLCYYKEIPNALNDK